MRSLTNTLIRTLGPLLPLFALGQDVRASVRVVNAAGGTPYTTIQAAVNAAVDGDVILVKPIGTYLGFTISNKELTVVGDSLSGVNVRGPVIVQNVTATRTVVLSRLNITMLQNSSQTPPLTAFSAFSNTGSLRLQQCTITGQAGWFGQDYYGYNYSGPGGRGAYVENCPGGVALEACTITGGHGGEPVNLGFNYCDGSDAGDGLDAIASRVVVYDCVLRGGVGGNGDYDYTGDGGTGLHLLVSGSSSLLLTSNSIFQGGGGGSSGYPGAAYPPSDGGQGLWLDTQTLAWILDSTFAGGPGGHTLLGGTGQAGQGLRNNGLVTNFQVSHVTMQAPALVRAQTQMSLTFSGDPGDEIFLFQSRKTSFVGMVSWRGFLLAKPVGLHLEEVIPTPLVTIPGSGQVTVSMNAPDLESYLQEKTVYYQAYRKTPSGSITLGSFAAVTVVAPGF